MSVSAQGTFAPSISRFDSQEVRIFVDDQGEPWFCATDVCPVLGYQNAPDAIAKHCRKTSIAKYDSRSGNQTRELTFINAGNLYRLLIKFHLPAAERFEAWVYDEVLTAIRKTGKHEVSPVKSQGELLQPTDLRDGLRKMDRFIGYCFRRLPASDPILIEDLGNGH